MTRAGRLVAIAIGLPALALVGCGPTLHDAAQQTLPVGDDPLALLPSGADLVIDVDVLQLRTWPETPRFLQLLPPDAQARLGRLGFDPLADVDQLVLSVAQLGTPLAVSTLLVRGDLDLDKARAGLGPDGTVSDVDYRGTKISEGPEGALARVTPRLFVLGSRASVRRVIDLARGEGVSVRANDRELMAALARAPTAKDGRPAIRSALVPSEPLRAELRAQGLPGASIEWLALSLAVGDGFDVGAIAGYRGQAEARDALAEMRASLREFAGRKTITLLGLRPYLDPIVMVGRDSELHLAYRLAGTTVDHMLARLDAVTALAHRAPAPDSATPSPAPEGRLGQ